MMKSFKKFRLTLLALSLLLVSCASTKPTELRPKYLSKSEAESLQESLAPPPQPNTAPQRADVERALKIQKKRKPSECATAEKTVPVNLAVFFGGQPLTESEVRELSPLFNQILADVRAVYKPIKEKYARARPYDADERLTPCIKKEKSFSYPSGHATIAYVFANALSAIFPSKKEALLKRAEQIAQDRVLGGVHFQSDVEAGKELADKIWTRLESHDTFQYDLRTGH